MATGMNRQKLKSDLKDKESREAFAEEHIREGIAFQLRALREARGLTQKRLSELSGLPQSNISKMENPNYAYLIKVSTLLRLGAVFDVPLIVHRVFTKGDPVPFKARVLTI
jgi:predicted XRE-type DNA-binding protein